MHACSERWARQLALNHWIERAIEAGDARSYGHVARALGLTQPRVTQIMGLLFLAPAIQEQVLLGGSGLGIRAAMRAARETEWAEPKADSGVPGASSDRGSRAEPKRDALPGGA